MSPLVRALRPADVPACEAILRALPAWFGIEASIREFVAFLGRAPGLVAEWEESEDGVGGFLGLRDLQPGAAEIEVMAVHPAAHRRGLGRALVAGAESWCRARGVRWLVVKTRGPSAPDPAYARTRAFYTSQGFEPILETTAFWGPEDPALLLLEPVPPLGDDGLGDD